MTDDLKARTLKVLSLAEKATPGKWQLDGIDKPFYNDVEGKSCGGGKSGRAEVFSQDPDLLNEEDDGSRIVCEATEQNAANFCNRCLMPGYLKACDVLLAPWPLALPENEMGTTVGELESAKRRALNIFDEWNDVTGFVQKHCGYYYELQAVIEDAVHCGAQIAIGVHEPLASEMHHLKTPRAADPADGG